MQLFTVLHTGGLLAPIMSVRPYLDPGTGSFLLQLLIATLLGAAFLLRSYIGKAIGAVRRLFSQSKEEEKVEENEKIGQ